ncbi:MAG: PorV/PorQ family protein [Candidatus Zixiibacteriota bacterium]
MKRILTILLLVALTTGSTWGAQSRSGASGAQFLKIGVGSRYQGLGEAAVAVANDVYSMYWNPAGLSEIEHSAVSFTTVDWLLDINLNYAAMAQNFEGVGVFGVSATVLTMGEQEITTFLEQDGTGETYGASSYAVGLSYARQMTDRFAFGMSAKYLGEKIYNEKSSGFAFDFGTLLYTGFRSLRLGMSITNMGPELNFSGPDLDVGYDPLNNTGANSPVGAELKTTPYDLPLTFRFGAAYDFDFGNNSFVTVATEMKHPNDQAQQGAFGFEYAYSEKFFLRSGYKLNYDEEGLTFGGGLATNISNGTKVHIDYAWQDFGRLESTHRFSVGFTF